jgi:anti-sigma B factor antagonist
MGRTAEPPFPEPREVLQMFEVHWEVEPGFIRCRPVGELDSATAPQLREALNTDPPATRLIIDLSKVPFTDSAGLGALIGGVRRVREAGGDVVIGGVQPRVLSVLRTAGFDRILPIRSSYDEAVEEMLAESPPAAS